MRGDPEPLRTSERFRRAPSKDRLTASRLGCALRGSRRDGAWSGRTRYPLGADRRTGLRGARGAARAGPDAVRARHVGVHRVASRASSEKALPQARFAGLHPRTQPRALTIRSRRTGAQLPLEGTRLRPGAKPARPEAAPCTRISPMAHPSRGEPAVWLLVPTRLLACPERGGDLWRLRLVSVPPQSRRRVRGRPRRAVWFRVRRRGADRGGRAFSGEDPEERTRSPPASLRWALACRAPTARGRRGGVIPAGFRPLLGDAPA